MVLYVRDLFVPQALHKCHRGRHKVPNISFKDIIPLKLKILLTHLLAKRIRSPADMQIMKVN
jgi:hypothetical protein